MLDKINENSYDRVFSTSSKIKEKELNADEFQATLNKLKKEEEEQEQKTSSFENLDLDISKAKNSFISYAQTKVYEDGLKQIEKNQINKLFDLIDKNNQAR
ncbi:hypothetical protein DMB92_04710 [Campylobacter sp. MIT 99-7217]|uniref:hypothetical protein n=1 Tax=Campylobacter sp. MIT 99-7217 TaxID=535091 RepID=UPI001159172C|nr:hypothetical protein [Campylobacter sp. MIT 99-7217]TQR32402.1 hypothetical protein DMB92_04710 [Campylobacter sp. MIT 99-7217]